MILSYDFTGKPHCLDRLEVQLDASLLAGKYCCSKYADDTVYLQFHEDLTEAEMVILEGVIAAHVAGVPCPDATCAFLLICPRFP